MLSTCPVLAYTPFVDDVLGWFGMVYTFEVGFGWAQWRRSALPYQGGLADQPHKLIEALEFVAEQRNALVAQAMTQRTRETRSRQRG